MFKPRTLFISREQKVFEICRCFDFPRFAICMPNQSNLWFLVVDYTIRTLLLVTRLGKPGELNFDSGVLLVNIQI